jgi:hypothetical protein
MPAYLDATNSLKLVTKCGGEMAEVKESVVMNPQNTLRCGRLLVDPDGNPVFDRHFCSPECKKADVRERQRQRRRRFAGQKCPYCGRKSTGDHKFSRGVSRHAPSTNVQRVDGDRQTQGEQIISANRL